VHVEIRRRTDGASIPHKRVLMENQGSVKTAPRFRKSALSKPLSGEKPVEGALKRLSLN
jgi:hypothetical protein